MTASEFIFLALGLVLGMASGVALVEVLRARPPAPRLVRVTVEADAIPRRRSSTLSDDAFMSAVAEPARGGPADRRLEEVQVAYRGIDRRTSVRSGPGVPVFATTAMAMDPGSGDMAGTAVARVAIPVAAGKDPASDSVR